MIRLTRSQRLIKLSIDPRHVAFVEHQDTGCTVWLTQGLCVPVVEQAVQVERLLALWRGAAVGSANLPLALGLDGEGTPTWVTLDPGPTQPTA